MARERCTLAGMCDIETKDVPGWPGYRVRSDGVVLGKSGRPLKPSAHKRTRHLRVRLYGPAGDHVGTNGGRYSDQYVHRVVCLAWYGEPPDDCPLVRHLDGDAQNNTPTNLVYGDYVENAADYWDDEEAVYRREERMGIRRELNATYEPDMFLGF